MTKMEVEMFGSNVNRPVAVLAGLTFTPLSSVSMFNLYNKAKSHQEELHSP